MKNENENENAAAVTTKSPTSSIMPLSNCNSFESTLETTITQPANSFCN